MGNEPSQVETRMTWQPHLSVSWHERTISDGQEKPVTWANLTSICSKVTARFAIAVRFYSSEKKFSASFFENFLSF